MAPTTAADLAAWMVAPFAKTGYRKLAPIAATLGIVEDIVSGKAIDDEIAIEVGAEQIRGHVMTVTAGAGANDVDGDVFAREDLEPTVDGIDAPAGFVNVHDMGAAQGIDEQFVSGLGEFGETLLGTHEGGGADVEVAVGAEEVADLAIGHAEPMLEFGGQQRSLRKKLFKLKELLADAKNGGEREIAIKKIHRISPW